jgi:hypothetical protein
MLRNEQVVIVKSIAAFTKDFRTVKKEMFKV